MASQTFEIPAELRTLAEKSVDEARKAFEGFIEAAQATTSNIEGATNKLQAGTKNVSTKALTFAEENLRAAFDHAEKLVRAKDPEEILNLQFEFARAQMGLLQEQIKELGGEIRKAALPGK
jgi:phasin